jgi:hypothetical protein
MALPIIDDVYRCAVNQHVGDLPIANVIHVKADTGTSAHDVADAVQSAWGTSGGFSDAQVNDLVYDNVVVTPLDGSSLSQSMTFGTADHHQGALSGRGVPPNVAFVISLHTAVRGRSHRGRIYLAGLIETLAADPSTAWSSTAISSMATIWSTFTSQLSAGPGSPFMVVASYKLEEALSVDEVRFNAPFGTQRKRAIP